MFEEEFGTLYSPGKGRPGLPIRLLVGLHYLKHAYDVSDEAVAERIHTQQKQDKKKVYSVHAPEGATKVHIVGRQKKKLSRALRKWFRRRAAIEPINGHLKSGHRMNRNHYHGEAGDAVNATLSAAGFNLSKLLAFFLRLLMGRVSALRLAGCRSIVKNFAFNMPCIRIFQGQLFMGYFSPHA